MHGWFFLKRHNTMAIGVAVDILGCTGSLEERAATLNRIILVALELKDSMGDLYAFSSIMKALDMPQVPNSCFYLPLSVDFFPLCVRSTSFNLCDLSCMNRSPDWIIRGLACGENIHRLPLFMRNL